MFDRHNESIKTTIYIILYSWAVNCVIGALILFAKPVDKIDANIFASQANIPANTYMTSNLADKIVNKNIKMLSIMSMTKKPTLMLMPEGAINIDVYGNQWLINRLGKLVPNDNSLLLAGGINMQGVAPYNVIYSFNKDGHIVDMYKKQKLVPFGEYIPFRRFLPRLTRSITGDSFDFAIDGTNDLFFFHKNLPIIYPVICYESIFPEYVKHNISISRRKLKKDITNEYAKQIGVATLKQRKELIVNLTNDVWMGWSVGTYQHFLMSRFLAVATGLPVVRVSNNGFSAFIDSKGRVKAITKLNKEDLLIVGSI